MWNSSQRSCVFLFILLVGGIPSKIYGATDCPPSATSVSVDTLQSVVTQASHNAMELRINGTYWCMPSFLGTSFISLYALIHEWLTEGLEVKLEHTSHLDHDILVRTLREAQFPDGSWTGVDDLNEDSGWFDHTLSNYWYLKARAQHLGTNAWNASLERAKEFILSRGGLARTCTMNKAWLSLFGVVSWDFMSKIPLFIFEDHGLGKIAHAQHMVAQWVYPHMLPISYLRHFKVSVNLGEHFRLDELSNGYKYTAPKNMPRMSTVPSNSPPTGPEKNAILKMLEIQQPAGLFGAYTVSTLFSIMSILDYRMRFAKFIDPGFDRTLQDACLRGLQRVDYYYFDTGPAAYRGVLDDGHYWDTLLISNALLEAGKSPTEFQSTVEYIKKNRSPNDAIGFGIDFWYAPDTDDTSMLMMFFHSMGMMKEMEDAMKWIATMQNPDGGWPAFDRDRDGSWIIKFMARQFTDSAELFDESCVDLTAHILEAMGITGMHEAYPSVVSRALKYVKNQQESVGSFTGRWGINYLYATGPLLVGLARVGELKHTEPWLQKTVVWLQSVQNADGGYGEAPRSYDDPVWMGRGVSTPSQTSWALMGLWEAKLAGFNVTERAIDGAVHYLLDTFAKDNHSFFDHSCVGTGHRHLLYMQYPSYAVAFPLQVLSRILNYEIAVQRCASCDFRPWDVDEKNSVDATKFAKSYNSNV